MTFKDWFYSQYPNPFEQNQWGALHITVLALCVAVMVALAVLLEKKDDGKKKIALYVLTGLILLLELVRRYANATRPVFYGGEVGDLRAWAKLIFPRPWCAISCWLLIASPVVDKKFFYNLASTNALICALIFFAYPGVGFNNQFMEFENVYSISTHALLLITSITLITLKFTDFRYVRGEKWQDTALAELIGLACVFAYATAEIFLKIEADPLYFMSGNDVMKILGVQYPLYVVLYAAFLAVYFNAFYLAPKAVAFIKAKRAK